jgi:hypothetical protein
MCNKWICPTASENNYSFNETVTHTHPTTFARDITVRDKKDEGTAHTSLYYIF